ncbi:MAG: hypothetical protein GC137_10020 [Alphaproteobacteria bacterium]|nr:hypothetical protein [Alphaproteobacteria bacterium]
MTDEDDILRYDRMVEGALRSVVKKAIEDVIEHYDGSAGMPGDHHFYITFLTDYPGVKIPNYLKERYPGEMTIVLQYQFSDLSVDNEKMSVTLSFNDVPEKLIVPLSSISIFADPSVNFALQFQPLGDTMTDEDLLLQELPDDDPDDPDGSGGGSKTGEVVSLDKFRKK